MDGDAVVTAAGDPWAALAAACAVPLRRLAVEGRHGFVLEPATPAQGRPWVLYAPCLVGDYPGPRLSWIFGRLLAQGVAVTGIDIGESYGSPAGRALTDAWHGLLVRDLGFAPRAVLLPQSRGGLMLYTWAEEHPEKAAGVTGIYTVCDFRSHPGLERTAAAWGITVPELASLAAQHNPVDTVGSLARADVPVWHIHGNTDSVVPLEANAGALVERCRAAGGRAELVVVTGRGHEEHADFFERQEVVESICRQAGV